MLNRCFLIFIVIIVKIQNLTGRNIVNISVFFNWDSANINEVWTQKACGDLQNIWICATFFFHSQLSASVSLIHITIVTLRFLLYLILLCSCLGHGLFMSHPFDLFFIFSLIFIIINHIISLKQTHLLHSFFLDFLPICAWCCT